MPLRFLFLFALAFGADGAFAEDARLLGVTSVPPPSNLYHWTTERRLWQWAQDAQNGTASGSLALPSRPHGFSMEILRHSFQNYFDSRRGVLFSWSHPTGGMANGWEIYPERFGGVIEGTAAPDTVLLDMEINPSARAIRVDVEASHYESRTILGTMIPEIRDNTVQLVEVRIRYPEDPPGFFMKEWIILDSSIIRRFNSDPTRQQDILQPELLRLRQGRNLPLEQVHIDGNFTEKEKGRLEAIRVLTRLLSNPQRIGRRLPSYFGGRNVRPFFSRCAELLGALFAW